MTPSWRLPQFWAVLAIAPPAPEPVLDAERPDQIESSSDYMQPLATHPRASLTPALQRSPPSPTVARLQNGDADGGHARAGVANSTSEPSRGSSVCEGPTGSRKDC